MSGKTQVTIQLDEGLCTRVDDAAKAEGITRSAWMRKTLLTALPPVQEPVENKGAAVMEAAFDSLENQDGDNDYPGVMPLPPPAKVAPAANVTEPRGHSCAYFHQGVTAALKANQIGGVCGIRGNGSDVPCHFASHTAKDCGQYKAMRVRVPPMLPLR